MATINDVADYIILRITEGGAVLDQLKLQKLLYYVQAWHLAFYDKRMFVGRFQAWIHGPVNRAMYDRFSPTKRLYSRISKSDIHDDFDSNSALSKGERAHINVVLVAYAALSGDQLEEMTHREKPWIDARDGYEPDDRCEELISEEVMGDYYRARATR